MSRRPRHTLSETDRALSRRLQVGADRLLLGRSPRGAMFRIVAFVTLFVLVGGTIMGLLNPLG